MEVFQLKTNSWFLPRELFLPDPLAHQQPPLLCHILTGALAVALPHRLSAKEYEQNLMGYLWRFKNGEGVLRVYNVTLRQVLRNEAELEVLCERICFRPEDIINSISVQEQLYLIWGVIRTVQALTNKFGFFRVTLNMVGLDQNGVVRVWIHSNHAENQREYQLSSEEQQFSCLMQLFSQLRIQNRLINAYLNNITEMGVGFKHHADYHHKFLRLHHIQVLESVAVRKIATGKVREREVESCPASSLKLTNETADITNSTKENSINNKKFQLSKSTEFAKRFPISPRLLANKENRRSSQKNGKVSIKSSFSKANTGLSPLSSSIQPGKVLATRARLQQSLMIDESFQAPSVTPIKLQLLGKMGKVCESMTAQELILEQFKAIYQ